MMKKSPRRIILNSACVPGSRRKKSFEGGGLTTDFALARDVLASDGAALDLADGVDNSWSVAVVEPRFLPCAADIARTITEDHFPSTSIAAMLVDSNGSQDRTHMAAAHTHVLTSFSWCALARDTA